MKTIVGLFEQEDQADTAIKALQKAGFQKNQFGVMARNRIVQKVNQAEEIKEGTIQADSKLGPAGGAVVGGLTGLLIGIGALAIPGIGPVVAAGSLASAIGAIAASAGLGATAGGLLGTLTSLGITEEEANFYAEGVKRGGILVIVEAEEEHTDLVKRVMNSSGAVEVNTRRQAWQETGWAGFDDSISSENGYPKL